VHLKPNQKWSDGSPITSADYISSLLFDFAPEYNNTLGVDQIQSVVPSGNDLVITYKGVYAAALAFGLRASSLSSTCRRNTALPLTPACCSRTMPQGGRLFQECRVQGFCFPAVG